LIQVKRRLFLLSKTQFKFNGSIFCGSKVKIITNKYARIKVAKNTSLYESCEFLAEGTATRESSIAVGNDFMMKKNSLIHCKEGSVLIGSNCALGKRAEIICEKASVSIGDFTRIAAEVFILTNQHRFEKPETPIYQQGREHKSTKIGRDVWIGRRAMIMPGVTIGDGVVVGAGAVVVKDLEDYSINAGVPAKKIGNRQ